MDVPPDPTTPAPRRRLTRFARGVAWAWVALVAGLFAFAYGLPQELRASGRAYLLAALVAFAARSVQFHLGLTLLAPAAVGLLARRWRLAGAALLGAAVLVGTTTGVGTGFSRPSPLTRGAAAPASLRLMSMNVRYTNRDVRAIRASVRAVGPDVLVVQEVTPGTAPVLDAALAGDYPHRLAVPAGQLEGTAVYSRVPLLGGPGRDEPYGPRAVVEVGGRRVVIYGVHLPVCWGTNAMLASRAWTADLLDRMAADRVAGRLPVLVGDTNYTATSAQAAAIRRAGFVDTRDLVEPIGRAATYGPTRPLLRWAPGVRIDHVYLSPGLTATAGGIGPETGSDHRPIWADVAVAP